MATGCVGVVDGAGSKLVDFQELAMTEPGVGSIEAAIFQVGVERSAGWAT